jgi:hypothetical protein
MASRNYSYVTRVKEVGTNAELLTVDRPVALPAMCGKFCCHQTVTVKSGGRVVGRVTETCDCCVPSFAVTNAKGEQVYLLRPPTCCGGHMVKCCTDQNNLCNRTFFVADPSTSQTIVDGLDTPHVGKIVKIPKSFAVEAFTDADAFELHFPPTSVEEKATLIGAAVLLNAVYFETSCLEGLGGAFACLSLGKLFL